MDQNKFRSRKEVVKHTYPSSYPKDSSHWAMRRSWDIMDLLKPGVISDEIRFFLAGCIAGALMRAVEEAPKLKQED